MENIARGIVKNLTAVPPFAKVEIGDMRSIILSLLQLMASGHPGPRGQPAVQTACITNVEPAATRNLEMVDCIAKGEIKQVLYAQGECVDKN